MHMLSPSLRRSMVIAAASLIALAASGCAFKNPFASKNPLIDDEPAPMAAAQTETAPAKKEATTAKSESEPAKPVLPKPVLVVKPAAKAKPADATPPAEQKQDAAKPTAPATEAKPAAPAEASKPAAQAVPATGAGTAEAAKPAAAATAPANATVTEPIAAAPAAPQPTIAKISDPGKPAPTGWARWLGIFKPYKINIQQGNFVSQDMAAQVRVGMTKEQVRFVLGTPLLTDMFHANRWDYLFRLQKPNGELTANRMAIFFRDNRIERIESSELPSESEYLTHIAGPAEQPAKPSAAPAAKPAPSTPEPSTKP